MPEKPLFYQVSDLAWQHLCALLGREQAPPRPTIQYDDNPGGYGWHMETHDKMSYTPGMSKAINKLRFAIPDYTQWLDYRPAAYQQHDHFFIGKFGATIYDTSEEPKRSRKLHLHEETRIYLVRIALNLKVKAMGKRTTETSLCAAVLEAMGLGSIRPLLDDPEQRRSLADLLKPIKLTEVQKDQNMHKLFNQPEMSYTDKQAHNAMLKDLTPEQRAARQALINIGVNPDLIEKYGELKDSPLIKDNTPPS